MKSIFKKVALVMALAMVVTMLPAKTVSAAETDGSENQYLRKNCTLYLDGDATETYGAQAWATNKAKSNAWKTNGYTVTFESEDESIATVGEKKGQITAVSVGETNIVATFSKGDEEIVDKIHVTVKRNAVSVKLDDASQEAINNLMVGDVVTLKGVETDADGNEGAQGEYATDYIGFKVENPEDKEILTVDKKTGELKAVAAGEATVKVYTYQYEWTSKAKKYTVDWPAKAEAYKVEVKEAGLVSATQINWNTVALACENATVAEDIVANKENLTVTYKLNENDITEYINYTTVKVDPANNTVVLVSLHNNLVKDYTYVFKYGESTASVTGVDLTAITSIEITTQIAVVGEYQKINVKYYDANHIELPADQMTGSLRFEAVTGDNDYFVLANDEIYFTELNKSAVVKVTYIRGYKDDGTADEIVSPAVTIRSVSEYTDNERIIGWVIDDVGKNPGSWEYSTGVKEIAVGDGQKQLYGKYTVTMANGTSQDRYTHTGEASFEYTSTNDGIIMIDPTSGCFYPVAGGTATIIVKRVYSDTNKPVVGTCEVRVAASRKLTNFTATPNKNKLAINPNGNDSVWISTKIVDQLGKENGLSDVNYIFKALNWVEGLTLKVNGSDLLNAQEQEVPLAPVNGGYSLQASYTGTKANSIHSVRFSITAKQNNGPSITRVITLSVRKVEANAATTWELELGKSNIDMNIRALQWWNGLDTLQSDIKLVAYDSNGFKVDEVSMDAAITTPDSNDTGYKYAIFDKEGKNVSADRLDGQKFTAVTVSGSAVSGSAITNKSLTKCGTGIYTVRVYKDGKLFKQKNIVVSDTGINTITVMVDKLNGADPNNLKPNLIFYKDGKKIDDPVDFEVLPVDTTGSSVGNGFYVSKIKVRETITTGNDTIKGLTYEYEINIGRTFYMNN